MKKFTVIFSIVLICVASSWEQQAQQAQQRSGVSYQAMAWSPDGRYIALTRMEFADGKPPKMAADIYVVKADGTDLKQVTGDERNDFEPAWSKDGKTIFFGGSAAGGKDGEIYSINRDGTGLRQLTKNFGRSAAPVVSANGKKIVFNSETIEHKPQIAVMNVDGSDIKALTNDNTLAFYDPRWSPDGKKLVYYVERGDRKDQIWVMNADGSGQKLLTNNVGHNFYPSWTADGKRIIFTSNRDGEDQVIYSMYADGTDIKRFLTPNSFRAILSPDGKKIAYTRGNFPTISIYVANADGSNQVKITP